ncbi:MAG: FAD-dependent monooxygenase [Sphingomonadaceae bacterium]|nr:FAD-dependent monooxygenase [Sphingomonadaceae bacterium]
MADSNSASVVISGAGPVGMALALALARQGVRTTLLEKKQELDRYSRAVLIIPRSLEFLDRLGVLDIFMAEGVRTDAIRMFHCVKRKPFLVCDFSRFKNKTKTPFALALSQDRTEHLLYQELMKTGLSEVRFNTEFDRFEEVEGGVRVYAKNGEVCNGDFLIGADGSWSGVRAQLGWQLEGETFPTRAVLADVKIAPEYDFRDGWLADPDAASLTMSIRFADGVWRIIEAAVAEHIQTDEDLEKHAKNMTDKLFGIGAWQGTIWTAAYRKHTRRSERYVSGRIVLAGDAAHINSPAGGQGLNAGFADVDMLSKRLAEALKQPVRTAELLADYERQRISSFDKDVKTLSESLEDMETAPAWARNIGFALLAVMRKTRLDFVEAMLARKMAMLHVA